MQVKETALAAKWLTRQAWRPASATEIDALAPMVDAVYERAAGLDGDVDPQVRPMLEALIPAVPVRRAVAEGLVDFQRIEEHTKNLDVALWFSIAAPVIAYVNPTRFGVRMRRRDMKPLPLKTAVLVPKNLREVPNE